MSQEKFTLAQIAELTGAEVYGDADVVIDGVNTLTNASASHISFLTNLKYKSQLEASQAAAVIMNAASAKEYQGNALLSNNPHATFAKVVKLFYTPPVLGKGIHASAVIDESATLGNNVTIAANAVIGANVVIGNNTVVGANTVIGDDSALGEDCIVYPNVTLYHNTRIGDRVVVHSQTSIGSDGFGFANDAGQWQAIPQLGGVTVGSDTSIGSGCTIDRGAIDDTVIGNNVILDNQVHVAHNCYIDDHACICGATGMAGSTHIGKYVVIGGMCSLNGHIRIADKVQITGNTMVTNDITEPGVYSSGQPFMTNREWRKVSVRGKQLPDLFDRVKKLERQSSGE